MTITDDVSVPIVFSTSGIFLQRVMTDVMTSSLVTFLSKNFLVTVNTDKLQKKSEFQVNIIILFLYKVIKDFLYGGMLCPPSQSG